MRIHAFEGLRYSPRAGDPDRLAAPPYDQIDDAARDGFHARSPYQFVHLTRPLDPQGGDPYPYAARLHQHWLAEGLVAREERPSLYPYVLELAGGGRRLGVLALVELADAGTVRPHERTIAKPLADRLALLEATRVDLEPALLVCEDQGRLDELLTADIDASTPLVRHLDADGHAHVLYRIDDPTRIAEYREILDVPTAVADGHHRWETAQRFAAAHSPAAGTAAAAKLAVITSLDSPALTIDPIHRALKTAIEPAKLAPLVASSTPFPGTGGAAFAAAVAQAAQPALGVYVHGRGPEVWTLANGPSLVVEILQDRVYPALGLSADAASDGTVVYRARPDELYAQVASGDLGTGFFLPPMLPSEFAAAIADGSLLPPKSTRFLPKVMSGLAWVDHASRLE
jgi:uncharacterized protein (DUF1015 family)